MPREKRTAFVWPSPISLNFPLSLQKCFGFCAIKFEERILFSTSSHLEGSGAWEAIEWLITSILVIRILRKGRILLRVESRCFLADL